MVSKYVEQLCQSKETVSSVLEQHPAEAPGPIFHKLYPPHKEPHQHNGRGKNSPPTASASPLTQYVLDQALKCGNWGPKNPSALFLQAFSDAIACLETDPTAGVVSPPLMGTHGTIPLTVIAPLLDVVRHCSNLIARAEQEVFFITSVWMPSAAQRLIKNALKELSRRAGERGRTVVVKMMIDKPAPSNAFDPHRAIRPGEWTGKAVDLPCEEDIPNIDMELVSLHHFVLGTLHAKFCIVDRKVAVVMSNNIEDNDNLEMMTHLEGPIVLSIYDSALVMWQKHLNQPLPPPPPPADEGPSYLGDELLYVYRPPGTYSDISMQGEESGYLPEHTPEDPHYDSSLAQEMIRMQSCYSTKQHENRLQAANRQLNLTVKHAVLPTGPEIEDGNELVPYIATETPSPVPMALVSRPAYGAVDRRSIHVPQNEAWLSLIRNAQKSIFIQTPDLNAAALIPALAEALKRGVEVTYYVCFGYNDSGEIIPGQGGSNEQAAQHLISQLPVLGTERSRLHIHNYVGKDQDHPIHNSFKSRSCHIKLLIADEAVGVQGSGNQDTQSWYHSQEINVMVESKEICEKWREAIERNQNTKSFGKVAEDGIWRDSEGKAGKGYMGNPGPLEGLLWGVGGMLKKFRDVGGI